VDAGYALKPASQWDMSFNLTFSRNTFFATAFPNIARDSHEIVAEWTNSVTLSSADRLTFGTLFNRIQGHENYLGLGFPVEVSNGSRPGGAAYAQLDHYLAGNLKLVSGLQVNKIAGIELNAVPRAGIIWDMTPRITVKALYSQAFRAPSINETRLDHPGLAGSANLRPEQAGTVDVSLSYQGRRLLAGVNYFYTRHTDSIIADTRPARWVYRNLGRATFHGVEVESKYYFRKNLFLMGSMMYQANHDGDGNRNVTPVANLSAKIGLSHETQSGLLASIFDNYQGPINGFARGINPPATSQHLLSARLRYDLSKRWYSVSKHQWALFAYADNLANRQVWLPDWGNNAFDTIPVHRGRTVYFGLEVSLRPE
jgi:outer membrane receptor protein involved in Fe transport